MKTKREAYGYLCTADGAGEKVKILVRGIEQIETGTKLILAKVQSVVTEEVFYVQMKDIYPTKYRAIEAYKIRKSEIKDQLVKNTMREIRTKTEAYQYLLNKVEEYSRRKNAPIELEDIVKEIKTNFPIY